MGTISVDYGGMQAAGQATAGVGRDVAGLAGGASVDVGGDPPVTASAVQRFGQAWGLGLSALGGDIAHLGAAAQSAAAVYQAVDAGTMPVGGR